MKPIGTITACFPYVDEDTKLILQFIMSEAKDYNDFAERLCMKAINEDLPELAIYFAYYHVYNQNKYNFLTKLIESKVDTDITRFFGLVSSARSGVDVEWEEYQKAMFSAMKQVKNDWMACHVYMAWRIMIEIFHLPEAAVDNETLDILITKIQNDDDLGFFRSTIHRITAMRLKSEGNNKECLKFYDKAIAHAKKHDDKEALVILLFEKANRIKMLNFNEALSILEVVKELVEELGYLSGRAAYLHELGHIAMVKGEFEKSIQYQKQYLASRKERGLPIGLMKCVLASIYNQKGDGETALKLVLEGFDDFIKTATNICHIQKTWAHILLDQFDEANLSLEKARESTLRIGVEWHLGYIHFLEGLIAKKNDDFNSAVFSFSQAMEIFERSDSLAFINFTLIEIVDAEIELALLQNDSADLEDSGRWMRKLLVRNETRNLPGIVAHTKLLVAKFRFKQGRIEESRSLVNEVLKVSEATGMSYLKDKVAQLLPDLHAIT